MYDLIKEAADAGVLLFVENGKLGFKLTAAEFPAALKQRIVANKADIVEFLSKHQEAAQNKLPELVAVPRESERVNASFAQQRLWFLDEMEGGSGFYNMPFTRFFERDFDLAIAEKALNAILERHEVLRTYYEGEAGQCVQVIRDTWDFNIRQQDFSEANEAQLEDDLRAAISEESFRPFNLQSDLMLRAAYFRVNHGEGALVITMHHIASDGWSLQVLLQEFDTLYNAFRLGIEPELDTLPIQYADYAVWQHQWMNDGAIDPQIEFWQKTLEGIPQVHNLPLDNPRPAVQTFNGRLIRQYSQLDYVRVSALAKQHGVTPFMLFLAGFALVMSRHSNSHDLVIGTPVSGRTDKALEGLIGFFVNMLVVRVNSEGNPSFIDYLQQVRQTVLDAQNNQLIPFEYLVERINPVRSVSHSPVFQILFSVDAEGLAVLETLTEEEKAEIQAAANECTDFNPEQSTAKYDITFDVNFDNGRLGFSVEFNTDLFNQETAERYMQHMDVLMQAVLDNPNTPVDALPMLTPAEQEYQLVTLNQSAQTYDTSTLVHELFEAQVQITPENIAVRFENDSLTYQMLNQQANQLARYLREQGVKPNDIVGICMDRGVELMVAILAVLKAGGGYLPIDSGYPQQRIDYICQNSGLKILLTTEKTLTTERDEPTLTSEPVTVLSIDNRAAINRLANYDTNNLGRCDGQTPQNLIYVIYTSGSTGNPKGVMIEHHNEVNLLHWYRDEYQFTASDKVLIISAAGFDLTQKNFFAPLLVGGSIHFATQRHYDIKAINQVIKHNQITIINCAPSVFYPLLELSDNVEDFASLRVVLFGGEPIAFNRLQAWLQHPSCHVSLVNMYGPTECTDIACAHTVTPERYKSDLAAGRSSITLPIGRPNHNVRLFVLNESLQLVPYGSVGELLIGGAGVGRGYIHRPELNAEKFIVNPFTNDANDLWYHTGDLVRYWPDGNIEFIGRVDHQVKLRGLRIELGEIETQLTQLESVDASLLMVREDQPGFQQLVAYVVVSEHYHSALADEQQVTLLQQRMRDALLDSLPDYMVPSAFILLPEFTLTPNGKIDRKALPVPATAQQQNTYVAPENALQTQLTELWQTLLGAEQVGIDDNFFELGGHSLLMTKLIHHVDSQLSCVLTLRDVFRHPTVRELSGFIERGGSEKVALLQGEEFTPAPLSYPQYRFWFIEQMSGPTNAHNIPTGYRIEGAVDLELLQQALNKLVERHRILRTEIQRKDGELIQQVLPPFSVDIEFHDISGAFVMGKDDKVNELAQAHGQKAFDLNKAPYFSVMLVKMKKAMYSLHINLHHLLVDGWSSPVFFNELVEIYGGLVENRTIELPKIPYHYTDFARWQHAWLATNEAREQEQFWQKYLHNCSPYLSVPGQKAVAVDSTESKVTQAAVFILDNEVRAKLLEISHAKRGSLFSVLYSGFCVLMSRITGEADFTIGVPVSGRNLPETQSMMGFFLNNLPVRNRVDLSLSFNDFLAQQVANMEGVLSHQELPFERIVELCSEPRSANDDEPPLYQVFFNMSNVPDAFEAAPEEVEEDDDDDGEDFDIEEEAVGADIDARFKFAMYISQDDQHTYINVVYNEAMFDAKYAAVFAEQLETLYAQIAEAPEKALGEYSLVCDSQHALFDQSLITKAPETLLDYLATVAKKHKRSTAIQYGDVAWTYSQLWHAAQQYAVELVDQPHRQVVAVIAQRSAALPLAVIAVLRAGKTFVVLDAQQPVAHLQQQIKQANAEVIMWAGDVPTAVRTGFAPHYPCIQVAETPEGFDFRQLEKDKQQHAQLEAIHTTPDSVATIAFTSGSTGEPLAVQGTHAGLSAYLTWMPKQFKLHKKQRFAMLSGLGHDPLQREMFTALSQGATLVIPTQTVVSTQLEQWVTSQQINVLHLTPSLAQILLVAQPASNTAISHVFITGETLPIQLAQQVCAYALNAQVVNSYGSTETQRAVTYYTITDTALNSRQFAGIAVSAATPDTKLMILNDKGLRCGISELGEVVLQSAYLSAGYLQNANLSEQKFHYLADGTKQYYTGDMGRYLPDGSVQLCGRKDQQLSLRGFRIDPLEIANALRELEGITEAAAHVQAAKGEQAAQLVGYVVSDADIDSKALINTLSQRLPSAKLPSQIIRVTALPMTANNKLDIAALPSADVIAVDFVAPVGEIEPRLAKLWATILAVDTPSATRTFSELGGNSIMITRIIHEIQQEFAVELSVSDCVTHDTIQTQSALIAQGGSRNVKEETGELVV